MPAQVLPDEGLIQQAQDLLAIPRLALPRTLILFKNDITPDAGTVLADLVQPSWAGYHSVLLDPTLFTGFTVRNGCCHCTWGSAPYVWYVTGGPVSTVYGWAAIDTLAGVIRRVQRFDDLDIGPVVVGGQFLLLPEFTLNSSECAVYADAPIGGVEFGGHVFESYTP